MKAAANKDMYGKTVSIGKSQASNLISALGVTALLFLIIKYFLQDRFELLIHAVAATIAVTLFLAFSKRLHQDTTSYFFVLFTAILHSLDLYQTSLFGIRFDHYMHFLGALSVAIIFDRYFRENMSKIKRFTIMFVSAIGVGLAVEIVQWLDGYIFRDVEMFRANEISNSISDMICNGFGGITMGIYTLFRVRIHE